MSTVRFASWVFAAALIAALPACGSTQATTSAGVDSRPGSASTVSAELPTVAGTPKTKPSITLPEGEPPNTLQVKVLDEGAGEVVKSGQQISVDYLGVVWPGGQQFDASYDRGKPATFGIGVQQVISGWDEGLVGQKVGSRVLLVIPPDKGYGKNGQPRANIKGTDTLVFVVEILAAK
jgi:peptidylprolyl isomerase